MSDIVSVNELNKALDNLVFAEITPFVSEGEITIAGIVERYELEHKKAKKIVQKLVADGKLEYVGKRLVRSNGRKVDAWKVKE